MLRTSEVTSHTGVPYTIPRTARRSGVDFCDADLEQCAACRTSIAAAVAWRLGYDVGHALEQTAAGLIGRSTLTLEQALDLRRQLILRCWQERPDWSPYRQGTTLDDLVVVDSVSSAVHA